MLKRLVQNTVISAIVFGAVAVLGVVVIPIIIRTWGVTEFGLIVLARLLLPSGLLGIIDFGLPEVTTQVVARAREHRNWAIGGSQLLLLTIVSVLLAGTLSALSWFMIPLMVAQFKIEPAHVASFTDILRYTTAANLLLFPALVWEGVVKGFERYGLLRVAEFFTTALYVAATIYVANAGYPYEVVAYCFLGSNVLRALILLGSATAAFQRYRTTLSMPSRDVRKDVLTRCLLVMQGKLIGGIIAPIQPFLIGIYLGPQSVGIYDTLVRIPRLVKVVASLLTSALLPVVSRLDQRANVKQFNRFGEAGIALLPMVTVPPMVAAAVLSPAIMQIWIGPQITPYAHWMGVMFVVAMSAQYVIFGNTLFMTRTKVQSRLNWLMSIQLAIWAVVTFATAQWLGERAYILGQAIGTVATLPWQLSIFVKELQIAPKKFLVAVCTHLAILAVGAVMLAAFLHFRAYPGIVMIAILMCAYSAAAWIAQYFLVLDRKERSLFLDFGRSFLGRPDASPAIL
ncbi:lipopolysaccharide biosynthesis protein [Bradyrhizobium canariense]|uniref:Membrane protein involved in the export of O-antigen and teichoic acid n=1 Tax=Bradyrhizobium canariense TaxID=255045 RepID=A0A1H1M3H9_9BRAD|nr:oligosaccharide flippase family protein [Bradyrhizobium canariense]SDR81378.1 Membrane protein involved in the export of O-antigen and teichoic acid [Bradyrhizobium canariense]